LGAAFKMFHNVVNIQAGIVLGVGAAIGARLGGCLGGQVFLLYAEDSVGISFLLCFFKEHS